MNGPHDVRCPHEPQKSKSKTRPRLENSGCSHLKTKP